MKKSILFNNFTQDEYEAMMRSPYFSAATFPIGSILAEEGDGISRFWYVEEGLVHAARMYRDGSLDLVQIYSGRDFPGLDIVFTKTKKMPLRLAAAKDSRLVVCDARIFSDGAVDAGAREKFTQNALRLLANESVRKQVKIDVLYKRSLRARICVFLSHMRDRFDSDDFEIDMNREQLSQYLGVNRSSLSNEISKMRDEELIKCRKGHFTILDPSFGESRWETE
jgi:CRP-like cAMP-binding protein